MNILFSTDSTVDLSREILERYRIAVLPLYIEMNGKTYRDGVDIDVTDIFAYVNAGNPICGTAAISIGDYEEFFAENLPKYDAIIHTTISSEFSSCYQNALAASAEMENVFVVDSRNLSTGIGHVVLQGIDMAATGADAKTCFEHMKAVTSKVETSFILNTLSYLAKGGRCSAVTALGANLLKLRPVVEVKDGKMGVGKKYRGAYGKCVVNYVVDRLKERDDIDYRRIFLTNAHTDPAIVDEVREAIKEYGQFEEILETVAGCTISSHCGPDCLGVLFMRK